MKVLEGVEGLEPVDKTQEKSQKQFLLMLILKKKKKKQNWNSSFEIYLQIGAQRPTSNTTKAKNIRVLGPKLILINE